MITAVLLLAFSTPAQGPLRREPAPLQTWIWELQRVDGSWLADDPGVEDRGFQPGRSSDDLVVTSLLTLASLGGGVGPRPEMIPLALDWIAARPGEMGCLAEPGSRSPVADHALASLALTEATVLEEGGVPEDRVRAAVLWLEASAREAGGWSSKGDATGALDLRATAWASLALASARDAELLEREELLAAAAWCAMLEGRERALEPRARAFELTIRLLAGERAQTSDDFARALDELLAAPLDDPELERDLDPERAYLQSLVAYQCGGRWWQAARQRLRGWIVFSSPREHWTPEILPGAPGGTLAAYGHWILSAELYYRYSRLIGGR